MVCASCFLLPDSSHGPFQKTISPRDYLPNGSRGHTIRSNGTERCRLGWRWSASLPRRIQEDQCDENSHLRFEWHARLCFDPEFSIPVDMPCSVLFENRTDEGEKRDFLGTGVRETSIARSWKDLMPSFIWPERTLPVARWTEEQKARIRDSRVEGTRFLAQTLAGLEHPPNVLVCASAIGIYGDRGDSVLTEESESGNGFLAGVCWDWETAADPAPVKGNPSRAFADRCRSEFSGRSPSKNADAVQAWCRRRCRSWQAILELGRGG